MLIKSHWLWQAVSHLKKMHSETIFSNLNFSGIDCANYIIKMVERGQFVQVDETGIMVGEVSTSFFGRDLAANDVLTYIRPEYRNKGLAKAANESFIAWAESRGAKLITIGQSTGCNNDEFKTLAKKLNLQPLGAVYGRLPCVAER